MISVRVGYKDHGDFMMQIQSLPEGKHTLIKCPIQLYGISICSILYMPFIFQDMELQSSQVSDK